VRGYSSVAGGHLPAAWKVAAGEADCCIATRLAARALGLDFVPLAVERYDLVTLRRTAREPEVEAVFDALNRANLRRKLELNFPSTVVWNNGAVFDLQAQKLRFLGKDGYPRSARDLELGDFGPRIGLAWKLADASVLRAGYGLTWIEQSGITTPFTMPLFPFIRSLSQPSLDNIDTAFTLADGPSIQIEPPDANSGLGQGVFAVERDQRSGYAQQWNLSLQTTFGMSRSVETGYLGSKLTNLGVPDVNLNQLSVEQLAAGAGLVAQIANPYFGEIPVSSSLGPATIARQQLLHPFPRLTTVTLYRNNVGNSTYHSLQAVSKSASRADSRGRPRTRFRA
jgi:hypothetical protein